MWKVGEVFGITRELPANYVARASVDPVFTRSLTRDKHVVIYGSSKQGKTSLRKKCVPDDDYIVVSCLNTMTLAELHGSILKSIGYRVEQSQVRTIGNHFKYNIELKGSGKIPFLAEASSKASVEKGRDGSTETTFAKLEVDLMDVNDIISSANEAGFEKYIVLEDFHYLPVETQKDFSFALKAFHENSRLCFIVIGVWREKNRLVYYNGDLTDRVVSIDADAWKPAEIAEMIELGEQLLNVQFAQEFKTSLLQSCFDSVYLAQEACHKACMSAGVSETTDAPQTAGVNVDCRAMIKDIVADQAGRYSAFLTNFAEGFSTQVGGLEMYKWVLYSVLSAEPEALESGIRRGAVSAAIKARHPRGFSLNDRNVTIALQITASLQVQKSIRPIILDYDQTTRVLNVVDRSFIIWLAYQDRNELLRELDINDVGPMIQTGEV